MPQIQIIKTIPNQLMGTDLGERDRLTDKIVERLNARFDVKKMDRPSPGVISFKGAQLGRFTLSKISATITVSKMNKDLVVLVEGDVDTSRLWWICAIIAMILDMIGAPGSVFVPWWIASGFSIVCYLFNMNHPKQDLIDVLDYVDYQINKGTL